MAPACPRRRNAFGAAWLVTAATNANRTIDGDTRRTVKSPNSSGSVRAAVCQKWAYSSAGTVQRRGTAMANVRGNIGQATSQIATRHPQRSNDWSRFLIRLASSFPTTFCITGATCQLWICSICPWTKVPVTPAHFPRSSVALGGLGMLLCPSLHSPRAKANGLPSFWMTSPFVRWPGRYCCCTCCLKVRKESKWKW